MKGRLWTGKKQKCSFLPQGLRNRQSLAEEWSKGDAFEISIMAEVVVINPSLQHGGKTTSRQKCPEGASDGQIWSVDSGKSDI